MFRSFGRTQCFSTLEDMFSLKMIRYIPDTIFTFYFTEQNLVIFSSFPFLLSTLPSIIYPNIFSLPVHLACPVGSVSYVIILGCR